MKVLNVAIARQVCAAAMCSFAVMTVGTSSGWSSPIIGRMVETGKPLNLTSYEISWMVSIMYIGSMASPIPAGFIVDWIGRRNSLLVFVALPVSSWLLILFTTKVYELYIARCLAGLWNGVVATVVPLYIAEISQAKVRGALSTLIAVSAQSGLLLSYVLGSYIEFTVYTLILVSIPILFFLGFVFMPESPLWYLMKQKREEAVKSLTWLRGADYPFLDVELHYMERSVNEEMQGHSFRTLFTQKGNRKGLIIVFILAICQRMSGISVLNNYGSSMLGPEGVGILTPNECVIVIGHFLILGVIIAMFLIDRVGRKPLLIASSVICGLTMFANGLNSFIHEEVDSSIPVFKVLIFSDFLIYSIAFSIGLGPVPMTIQGEIFPANIKGVASGISAVIFSLSSIIISKLYHPVRENVGSFLNFWIFTCFCILSALFVTFYFIETKGKTLREIQEDLDHKRIRITRHHT